MNYSFIVKNSAEKDIHDTAHWYNSQKKGLGNEFLLSIEACFYTINRNPKMFQIQYKSVRRCFMGRFPYGIYYKVERTTIYVLAVIYSGMDEKNWKSRIIH